MRESCTSGSVRGARGNSRPYRDLQRREFVTLLGGTAAWPLAARAQQGDRLRRIGVLMGFDENDPLAKPRVSAFTQALADLGWTDGRNVRIDLRWYGNDINYWIRAFAQELVALQPDIIVTSSTPATAAVQQETRTIPIVLAGVADPISFHAIVRRENLTGFAILEGSLGGKRLKLLSEIAPGLKRAAIMFNPDTADRQFGRLRAGSSFMRSFETAARLLKVVPIIAPVRDDVEIETVVVALGREPGGGLVVMPDAFALGHRASIISAAARNNVPAVYALSEFVRDGGLLLQAAPLESTAPRG
jgi:putative ABC transport system substrate-binding protein